MKSIKNFPKKEFIDYLFIEFGKIEDPQLLILKGHVLLEYMLNMYLSAYSNSIENDFSKEAYSFAEKTKLLLLFGDKDDITKSAYRGIRMFNIMRNTISHDLSFRETDVDKLLGYGEIVFDWNLSISKNSRFLFSSLDLENIEIDGVEINHSNIDFFKKHFSNFDFEAFDKKVSESEGMQETLHYRNNIKSYSINHKLVFFIGVLISFLYLRLTLKTGKISEFLNSHPIEFVKECRIPNIISFINKNVEES